MNKTIESLWPSIEEIEFPDEIAPVHILQEQARMIGEQTHNIIEGQVIVEKVYSGQNKSQFHFPGEEKYKQIAVENDRYMRHSLFVRAPILNGFKVRIVSITYHVSELFPLTIQSMTSDDPIMNKPVGNQNDLMIALHEIFHSPQIKGILGSLLAQSGYKRGQ